jgi:membrane-bound serine protease (ClpP class)
MKFISILLLFLLPLVLPAQTVFFIKLNGTINPATAEFIHRSIEKATREKAECLVIQLNTPGGLLESTRRIVGDMLESTVAVVVFVSPGGAHAGSAGVFLTLAAHIAAMAPGTNLGAAHPVDLQGGRDTVMDGKVTNDASAFIRTIAEKRHRNGQWAELAVRRSVSLTENEALAQNVIDLIARDPEDLLNQIDGKNISSGKGSVILHTRSAHIVFLKMGFTEKILDLISNPNITYILLLLGLYGLLFEFYNPGSILPGIVGVISLILAFYSMQTLPVNYAGLALIIFAIILFLLDIKLTSHGLLTIGGIVSLLFGSIMLIRPGSDEDFVGISRVVIIVSTVITTLFFLTIIGLGLKAQRGKPVTGREGLIGEIGETLEALIPAGSIRVHGEHWKAESVAGDIGPGKKVRVIRIQNWKLYVEQLTSH